MTRVTLLAILCVGLLTVGPGCGDDDRGGDSDSDSDSDGDSDTDSDSDSDTDTDSDTDSDYTCPYECISLAECTSGDGEVKDELTCPDSQVCCYFGTDTDTDNSFTCVPTTSDPELACTYEYQCCGFPGLMGELELETWEGGCSNEDEYAGNVYFIFCYQLGQDDAYCECDFGEAEDW